MKYLLCISGSCLADSRPVVDSSSECRVLLFCSTDYEKQGMLNTFTEDLLTLKAPLTAAGGDNFFILLLFFREKQVLTFDVNHLFGR